MCAGAVVAAGTSRAVDSGWAIVIFQLISNLCLALGGALSTSLSLSSVISFGIHMQVAEGATFMHRLAGAPMDLTLVYRAWLTYSDLASEDDLDPAFPEELAETLRKPAFVEGASGVVSGERSE